MIYRNAELEAEQIKFKETHAALEQTIQLQRNRCEELQGEITRISHLQQQPPSVRASGSNNNSRVSWQAAGADQRTHARTDESRSNDSLRHQQQQQRESWREASRTHDVSQLVDGNRFEESVGGGGLATSTPSQYALHPPETAQQAIQEKNTLISLFQVILLCFFLFLVYIIMLISVSVS